MDSITSLFQQSSQLTTFLVCLLAGLAYVVASGILGMVFGGDGTSDSADGSDGDSGDSHDGMSIFSPKVIAIFAIGMGSGGSIATAYGLGFTAALLCGIGAGASFGGLLIFGARLLYKQRSSSDVQPSAAIGLMATVTIAIPSSGTGEVSLPVLNQYMTYLARSQSNQHLTKGTLAKVVAVNGGTLIVE
jgi:membrane protein implicated in regulation of membrane protease activity